MRKLYICKGMTLVEVIIAIAILGIIVVSFLGAFVSGITSIFIAGRKSNAVATAQEYVDTASASGIVSLSELSNECTELNASFYTYDETKNGSKPSNYYIDNNFQQKATIDGTEYTIIKKKLTVLVFFDNGKRYVTLTSLLP